jgi:hypothetical protein
MSAKGGGWAMSDGSALFIVVFVAALVVAIIVALARWIFRIDDIVSRLDNIVELLRKAQNTP